MRLPRAFASATPLAPPPASLSPFGVTVAGPGWELVPRCTMELQKDDNWCWAAVGQCIERHFQTSNPTQCQVAQRYKELPCCSDKTGCTRTEPLEDVLRKLGHLNPPATARLTFSAIVTEIQTRKRPICCFIRRSPNNHFVTIAGFRNTSGKQQLAILDPAVGGPPEEHDYATFSAGFKKGFWEGTFLTR
ncbi:MAG TPA: papain-like cysteine protease family protein [Thermoanaerobaculia bacterium]